MEKRAFERIPTSIKVSFTCCKAEFHGVIRNCSESGMFISTKKMFYPFDSKIEVMIPFDKNVLTVPVSVARSITEDGDYSGIGVKLISHPSQYISFVDSLKWTPAMRSKAAVRDENVYICKKCLHAAFRHAPVDCPVCGSAVENFDKCSDFINYPADCGNLSEFEQKHVPVITLSKDRRSVSGIDGVDIHIKVGELEHPMGGGDHISFIDFYFDDYNINKRCLARINLMCGKMQPSTGFRLNSLTSGTITVVAHCSAHGSWMSRAEI